MNNIENIAQELFNKIRSRFDKISIADEDGKSVDDPLKARFFNFEYTTNDGFKHGEITIAINETRNLEIIFNKEMNLSEVQESQWEQFLRSIRKFAKRNAFTFDVRDITRNNLSKRDIVQKAKSISNARINDISVNESIQWSGTTRTSIQDFGSTRLIVRHNEAIDDKKPGSRSRKIESIFVETASGERFRMPHNKLSLGRAMAQHLAHDGKIYDEAGQHIQEIAEEMSNLSFFVRHTRHRQFEDIETAGMVESAIDRYKFLKNSLNKLTKAKGYRLFAETFVPETEVDQNFDFDALKERFVKKMFDDRLTSALPYVYRAYQTRSVGETKYLEDFGRWTDDLVENQLDDPDLQELARLMKSPIRAGEGGINAQAVISDIVDNDELNDLIVQAAQIEGSESDVRQIIDDWFLDNYPDYSSMMPQEPDKALIPDEQPIRTEDIRSAFANLRKLAGLTY